MNAAVVLVRLCFFKRVAVSSANRNLITLGPVALVDYHRVSSRIIVSPSNRTALCHRYLRWRKHIILNIYSAGHRRIAAGLRGLTIGSSVWLCRRLFGRGL